MTATEQVRAHHRGYRKPIVVTVCMLGSSESWEPQQAPLDGIPVPGRGAVHSIKSRLMQPQQEASPAAAA